MVTPVFLHPYQALEVLVRFEQAIEVIVLQLGKLDLTSPAGRMMLAMLAAVGKMERDLLVKRTQAGLTWVRPNRLGVHR